MKLFISNDLGYNFDKSRLLSEFVLFCAEKLPIENDFKVFVVNNREPHSISTTAVYECGNNTCKIYGKNRALVDVMRSIAHEMTHMMQDEMGLLVGHIQDAGGFHEDQANSKAGELIKLFAKSKEDRKAIYESKRALRKKKVIENMFNLMYESGKLDKPRLKSDAGFGAGSGSSSTEKVIIGKEDFESGKVSINKGIKWGPGDGGTKRSLAFRALSYFLPNGTVLTSCYRSQADQERIIKNYAIKKGYKGDQSNFDKMHAFTKKKGLIIARKVGRGHGGVGETGAFDLSGVPLDQIWKGVENANKELAGKMKFAKLNMGKGKQSIIERKNNAVHVHFNLSDVKLTDSDIKSLKSK